MFLIVLVLKGVLIKSLDLDHSLLRIGKMPQGRRTLSIIWINSRALFIYQISSPFLLKVKIMLPSCFKLLLDYLTIQLLIETGKNKKLILPDLFIKYFQISSNLTDQNNLETWTNIKNSAKLSFKNFLKYPNKRQEYINKMRKSYKNKQKPSR